MAAISLSIGREDFNDIKLSDKRDTGYFQADLTLKSLDKITNPSNYEEFGIKEKEDFIVIEDKVEEMSKKKYSSISQIKYNDILFPLIELDFDVEKTKRLLSKIRFIFKYSSFFLFSCFVISFFVGFIHPLFWLALFFGAFGIYGSTDIRIREELNG